MAGARPPGGQRRPAGLGSVPVGASSVARCELTAGDLHFK